jgi:hypothetical protein
MNQGQKISGSQLGGLVCSAATIRMRYYLTVNAENKDSDRDWSGGRNNNELVATWAI